MKNVLSATTLFIYCAFFTSTPLYAHHGLEQYDTAALIEIKGKVSSFLLQDPHSLLYVDVKHENGDITQWIIEGGAAHGIVAAGLTKQKLASHPTVIVKAYQSADGLCEPQCKASGQHFVFEE